MGSATKREYIDILRKRYQSVTGKNDRTQIINELIANTGMHRKSAIRSLLKKIKHRKQLVGRKIVYNFEVIETLKKIWVITDYMCSKKLRRVLPEWIKLSPYQITPENKQLLLKISSATMDRCLKPWRAQIRRRKNSGTRPGSQLFRQIIPIKALDNIPQCAGHLEADTVAHCGGNMSGEFIWSITITDTYSGWTENRAIWGKSAENVHTAIADIEASLPFDILSFNCDNGSEFLNHRLVEYFSNDQGTKLRKRFVMTRSRPYKKNDNAHVEQKNWTSVRKLFGYERLEHKELLPIMNEIYRNESLFKNYWIPQFKLKSKVRVGTKIKKTYHEPETPYKRLLVDPAVTEASKIKLREVFEATNPFELSKKRQALLSDFYKLKRMLTFKIISNNDSNLYLSG